MSTSLKKPEECKKGMPRDQPQLKHVTPTALLGSWVQQPIKDMVSLRTDFEMHANWQGNVEEPAAKNFVARKARTIALRKLQGAHWSMIRCKERLANYPEALLGQATINLDSQFWKSLEYSLPVAVMHYLVEAHVMQESRACVICDRPTDVHMRNLRQKAERVKITGSQSTTRFL
jgi:hypothetical protein